MSSITSPPNEYDFGLEFNYSLWTQDTEISLVNVPWNNDYRDIVKFESRTKLNEYIDSLEVAGIRLTDMSYLKPNLPIRISLPFNKVYKYNYLRASNFVQPIAGDERRDFYYFINDVRYIAPNTTELVVQLDVWQTFGYDFTFGNCYVERGHIGIANEKQFQNYGRDYLTVPEGLDTGAEYRVTHTRNEIFMSTGNDQYDVIVVSTVDLDADPGTVQDPKLNSAGGTTINNIVSGANIYVFTQSTIATFLSHYKDKPWITQGIMGIYVTPKLTRYTDFDYTTNSPSGGKLLRGWLFPKMLNIEPSWRDANFWRIHIPERYWHLKKFFTFPYMAIEMTTFSATPIIIKPESWNDANARVVEHPSFIPGSTRIVFRPVSYNSTIEGNDGLVFEDYGEFLDFVTLVENFVSVPIVNNMGLSYLASNRNSIMYQRDSAEWTQQRALRGNEVSYDQATSAVEMSRNINRVGIAGAQGLTASQNLAISQGVANQAMYGMIGSGFSGAMTGAAGGPAGAAGGAVLGVAGSLPGIFQANAQAGVQQDLNNRNTQIQNQVSQTTNMLSTRQQEYIRDTNKDLADWAARGDYEMSIAGVNAKVNDSRMIQPSISGQFGGNAFNLVNGAQMLSLRWKMLDLANMAVVGEYWLRYGYAVQRFMKVPNIMVMSHFTYWKLKETYIQSANMPEAFKQIIRGIFEKGVTVWDKPEYIGQIDIGVNKPIEGISY